MATIAEFRLPTDEFVLNHTIGTLEDITFEIERIVAHDPEEIMPYVWATGTDPDELESVLAEDPSVDAIERISQPDDSILYQMHWIESIQALVHILTEEDGTILVAESEQEGWFLRVLFPDRDSLSRAYDYCTEHGFTIDIQRIYNVDDGKRGRFGLTDEQEDTIAAAYEHGYYDVPRGISLSEFAEELDVSHQALSERLRRGHKTLVENSVIVGRGDADENEHEG